MIKSFKIKNKKDENGYYILPSDVVHRDGVMANLKYHIGKMESVKKTMFAMICSLNRDDVIHTAVNGWTENYVRINGVKYFFDHFYLDEENDILYKSDNNYELLILKRKLKLQKILE